MSKVTHLKCDFCGKDESQTAGTVFRHKIRRRYRGYDSVFCWKNLDICTVCLDEIRRRARERKE